MTLATLTVLFGLTNLRNGFALLLSRVFVPYELHKDDKMRDSREFRYKLDFDFKNNEMSGINTRKQLSWQQGMHAQFI